MLTQDNIPVSPTSTSGTQDMPSKTVEYVCSVNLLTNDGPDTQDDLDFAFDSRELLEDVQASVERSLDQAYVGQLFEYRLEKIESPVIIFEDQF